MGSDARTLDETRELGAALHAAERGPAPRAARDELEAIKSNRNEHREQMSVRVYLRASGDLLASSGNADDGADTPALVARL